MKAIIIWTAIVTAAFISCSKKSPDVPIVTVPERIVITPANKSIQIDDTAIFSIRYYNNTGVEATPPSNIIWTSSNAAVAAVSTAGVAIGKSTGQVTIQAGFNSINASALLSVVANDAQLATISIDTTVELGINEMKTLMATAANINGITVPGKTFNWQINNGNIINLNQTTGKVTGLAYGTALVTASSEGISSNTSMVQVVRKGAFNGMESKGTAALKVINGVLKLQTSADFAVSTSPPDLRMYLSNNSGNTNGAIEIATLATRSGAQSWPVSSNVSITDYKYVLVWCKQFGGSYGVAELQN